MAPQEDVDDVVIHPGSVAGFSTLPELLESVLAEMRTPINKHATRQIWVTSDLRQSKVLLTGTCRVANDTARSKGTAI
jgi:hypothetical protein